MRREFFMEGETLMVRLHPDKSTVVSRPATADEVADHEAHEVKQQPKKAKKAKK